MRYFSARETAWLQELDGIELASFHRRALAFLIDSAIAGILLSMLLSLGALGYLGIQHRLGNAASHVSLSFKPGEFSVKEGQVEKLENPAMEKRFDNEFVHVFSDIVVPVLYFGILLWKGKGRTPGKRWMKIRVVSIVHPHLTFWHSVERALGYGAAALEAGFGFLQFFIHPYRRCAQDRLAETIVVTERAYQKMIAEPAAKIVEQTEPGA